MFFFHSDDPCASMNYEILNDATRNVEEDDDPLYCDQLEYGSPDWKGANWYRMVEPAGVQMPEYAVDKRHCGAHVPGWLTEPHPTVLGLSLIHI